MADGSTNPQKTFRWDDPLDLSGRLTEDERADPGRGPVLCP